MMEEHPLRNITALEARGQLPSEEAARLRQPEWLDAWHDALHELHGDLQAQFASRKADALVKQQECYRDGEGGKAEWFEYKAEYETWRAKTNWFKRSIDNRINEVKRLKQKQRELNQGGDAAAQLQLLLDFLRDESNIAYSAMPRRDELIEQTLAVLMGRTAA